ncbi:P-loop ATPase [Acinetobacter sp. SFB]|uniref:KAP family P-loop NTPase fold protein n=1 Tax=Acinetobacter sp. SFB TaxID=1805634 RepID=UPI0007D7E8D4|nr:P-loop NTPase fold protein [Acinetobacter sp. SFB]OAL78560.1 P-loop ATPase [Acinetobacter sp. SFB]
MTEIKQLNWAKDDFENIEAAWEGDLWDRKRLGEQLTNYVDRLQCGAVLALDARWGEGKTWFVRHWKKHLENENHNVIYLDAFANDYLDDPFLTIAAEISQAFKGSNEIDAKEIEDFNSKTASVLISLAAVIPMIAAKASMHWIGLGGAGEAIKAVYDEGKDVFDVASDEIASKVKEKIENHHIEKQTIQDFKNELAKLAEKLDKTLVFIIDELDRCRPDFAIRLIERIKHFFDIPKIVFILVMDKTQFSKVVCHNYGYDETLGEEYLDKFVDFTIYLKAARDAENFEAIIKTQLYKIGELTSLEDRSELYFWLLYLQLDKKLNSRELIKKINQYALLKTDSKDKNLILLSMLLRFPVVNNFKVFLEKIALNLIEELRGDKHQFVRKHNIDTWSGSLNDISNVEWYKLVMEREFDIKDSVIDKILAAYMQADRASDQSSREYSLKEVLEKLAITSYTHSNNFIRDWENYIKRGIQF